MFKDEGKLRYADDEDDGKSLKKIKAFTADENSLKYILKYLTDIRDEVPDIDGEREIVELWRDSDVYEKWNKHLNRLIERINEEIDETCCNRR
ncbi:MAG: hypothetical protein LBQ16_06630 [Gracilibacteraceae bacterium]|nr:hypothetical protein [Gracilibacteraceae bacterium]